MKVASLILLAVGLLLIGASFFLGGTVHTPSEEEAVVHEQAVTDLHGIANRGESSEQAQAKIAAAKEVLLAAKEKTAAAEARSQRLAWIVKIVGLLVVVGGAGMHFYAANRQ